MNNELRLGNLIYKYNLFRPLELNVISVSELPLDRPKDGTQYKSIPLTAEWLKKLGFERDAGREGYYWKKDKIELGETSSGFFISNEVNNRNSCYITTVHDLQNFVFIFSNEELK